MATKNGKNSTAHTKSKPATAVSTHDQIALRAYEIYLGRNGAPGNPLEDWVRAERELVGKPKRTTRKSSTATAA